MPGTSHHHTTMRVRLKEVAYDHVYFGTFFTWFEEARTDLSHAAGMPYQTLVDLDLGSFVTFAGATYHAPVPPDVEPVIESRIASMSRIRFAFAYDVYIPGREKPAVTGYSHHAVADLSGKLRRIPSKFADAYDPTGEAVPEPDPPEPDRVNFTQRFRVRYQETDAFQVVYYGNYFSWMEAAWSGQLFGTPWDIARGIERGRNLPVIDASCKYLSPARYDDVVAVEAKVSKVSATRLRMDWRVRKEGADETCALGHTVHAVMDGGRPARITQELLSLLGAA